MHSSQCKFYVTTSLAVQILTDKSFEYKRVKIYFLGREFLIMYYLHGSQA